MRRPSSYWFLPAALAALTLLAVALGQHHNVLVPAEPTMKDWKIPDLVAHLNRAGLRLRPCPSRKTRPLVRRRS